MWEDFSNFWDFINKNNELTSYAIETYLDLIDFYGLGLIIERINANPCWARNA